MGWKIANLQQWLNKNRMLIWWLILLPLLLLILLFNRNLLDLPSHLLNDSLLSFQYKVINTTALIVLARIALIAIGLVIIMICLFFPLFQVSKSGVQWTKELEEKWVEASGEVTGEEIDNLIQDEVYRLTLIHNWVKLKEPELKESHLLLRELLATIWEGYPDCKLSLCRNNGKNYWGLTQPLLTRLIIDEPKAAFDDEPTYGLRLQISREEYLLLHIYSGFPEGFSKIDEKFILVLGDIYLQKVGKSGAVPEQLLAYFDQIPLTAKTAEVYDEGGVI